MRRRDWVCGLTALAAGCGRRGKRVIGVVPKGATQMFWQSVHAGAIKAGREFNVEVMWNAPAQESDRSRQIAIVDSLINVGVDAIALAPVDRSALVNVAHRAIDRGIPVAVFDSELDSTRIVSYVATDNVEGGRSAARRMGEALNGRGTVAIVDDMPGSASTTARVNGFQEECRSRFPAMRMLPVQFAMGDRAKARAVAENLMTAHLDLAGIFADHENAVAGVALALSARENRSVRLVGFDVSDQLVDLIKQGWVDSLVVQNPLRMGEEVVRALGLKLSGKVPAARIDTGSTVVRREDLERPEIRALIAPDWKGWFGH